MYCFILFQIDELFSVHQVKIMINENIKLVIWDLDDTFWDGTLSEGNIKIIDTNIEIVRKLIDRGIMCSIVSKNNFDDAKEKLVELGVWDFFIFPNISWLPKGEQVKYVLEKCSLRPNNTLFIDDNISNLKEVEFYNPGIMVELPSILNASFLNNEYLKGKNDENHSRLKQYKILETRNNEEAKYATNDDFLRESEISISIIEECLPHIDRISELVERTNQLNYTKIRLSNNELINILNDKSYSCACISVKDKYGEYGITGFYALKNNRLEHFLFSCRTIGFGIENYLYKKLGYPEIDIILPISTELTKEYAEKINWICESQYNSNNMTDKAKTQSVLMVSGCDLSQSLSYLEAKFEISTEFNTVVDGREIRTSDTSQLLNAIDLDEKEKDLLCEKLPFFENGITFSSKIFSGEYSTIIFSVVDDYIRGIYKNKKIGYEIAYGAYYSMNYNLSMLNQKEKDWLLSNFDFVGKETVETFENNLNRIINNIDSKIHIILINGIDIDVSDWIGEDNILRNREMNAVVDRIVQKYPNVDLLDMRTIVTSREYLPKHDNRHFSRITYYKMAIKLAEMIDNKENIKVGNYLLVEIKKVVRRKVRLAIAKFMAKRAILINFLRKILPGIFGKKNK